MNCLLVNEAVPKSHLDSSLLYALQQEYPSIVFLSHDVAKVAANCRSVFSHITQLSVCVLLCESVSCITIVVSNITIVVSRYFCLF